MFSIDHFIWIGISLFFAGILLFFSRKFKFSFKTATYVILGIYLISEISKIFYQVLPTADGNGFYFNPSYLPLQMCSITLFFVIYLAFSKNVKGIEFVKSFVIEMMLIAAPVALLFGTCFNSENTAHAFDSFKDFEVYQFFLYHSGMVWYGLYLVTTKQVKMGFKPWWQSLIVITILLLTSVWINGILSVYHTNFMFTVTPPVNGIPLINLKHGYAPFLIHYLIAIAFITLLFQLPSIIKQQRNKKVSK